MQASGARVNSGSLLTLLEPQCFSRPQRALQLCRLASCRHHRRHHNNSNHTMAMTNKKTLAQRCSVLQLAVGNCRTMSFAVDTMNTFEKKGGRGRQHNLCKRFFFFPFLFLFLFLFFFWVSGVALMPFPIPTPLSFFLITCKRGGCRDSVHAPCRVSLPARSSQQSLTRPQVRRSLPGHRQAMRPYQRTPLG